MDNCLSVIQTTEKNDTKNFLEWVETPQVRGFKVYMM